MAAIVSLFMTSETTATIKREFGVIVREGRGFSLEELKKAAIDIRQARKFGLPIDILRKSAHTENVEKLGDAAKRISEKLADRKKEASKPRPERVKTESPSARKTGKRKGIKGIVRKSKESKKQKEEE